jgi:LacI family gluconate utilization system Gnt-I transcriptional repressor
VRKKVGDAIARTGYVPNILAGGLASARSRLVAAVVPTIAGPVFLETVQSLTGALAERGYQLMLGQSGYAGSREDALLGAIIGRRPDGIVLTGIMHSAEGRKRLLGRRHPGGRDLGPHADADRHAGRLLPRRGRPRGGASSCTAGGGAGSRSSPAATSGRSAASTPSRPPPRRSGSPRCASSSFPRRRRCAAAAPRSPNCSGGGACRRRDLLQLGPARARRHDRGAGARHRPCRSGSRSSASATLDFAADLHPALTTVRIDGMAIGRQAAQFIVDRAEGREVATQSSTSAFISSVAALNAARETRNRLVKGL